MLYTKSTVLRAALTIVFLSSVDAIGQLPAPSDLKDGTIKWSYRLRGVVTKGGVA